MLLSVCVCQTVEACDLILSNFLCLSVSYSKVLLFHSDLTFFNFDVPCRLRFQLLLDKKLTTCQISGDLFDVEIVLDGRDNQFKPPLIHDVKVTYSKQMKSCPELVKIIR